MISLVLIALSLSMDAFAVSVSSGIAIRGLKISYAIRAALFFGLFQFLMPVAGWFLGRSFSTIIAAYDHWIALALLAFIGGKMIWEALRSTYFKGTSDPKGTADPKGPTKPGDGPGTAEPGTDIRNLGTLLTLAVATSIDALAVGISFSILDQGIWGSAALIGGITFLVCLTGFEFGRRIGLVFERGAQILGGLILIGIGIRILITHLRG
jgi:putative Mn2+ efflux pump MntP